MLLLAGSEPRHQRAPLADGALPSAACWLREALPLDLAREDGQRDATLRADVADHRSNRFGAAIGADRRIHRVGAWRFIQLTWHNAIVALKVDDRQTAGITSRQIRMATHIASPERTRHHHSLATGDCTVVAQSSEPI